MPRFPRSLIKTSYFHVIIQGINKSFIFNYPDDIKFYISTLYKLCTDYSINIIAYCIMNNHAHMLLNTENIKNLSDYMHKVNTRYALYYNKKYKRVGYVFRNRYKSEGIYSEEHLYNCIKYIYDNPVKAGICKKASEYPYSNFKKSIYINCINNYVFLDTEEDRVNEYMHLISLFLNEIPHDSILSTENHMKLKNLIKTLKDSYKVSFRTMSKELKINRDRIRKIYKE